MNRFLQDLDHGMIFSHLMQYKQLRPEQTVPGHHDAVLTTSTRTKYFGMILKIDCCTVIHHPNTCMNDECTK